MSNLRPALPSLLLALLAATAPAQRTLVVDASGGAGSQFRAIQPAVDAALPGDIVLVRAGLYREIVLVDKGIRLIGQGARMTMQLFAPGAVQVHDVPSGQTFAMRGFIADDAGDPRGGTVIVAVENCLGLVSLRDLRQSNLAQWAIAVGGSAQVHVTDVVLRSARSQDSSTVFERVVFDPAALQGLFVRSGDVHCVRCAIRGSFGTFTGPGVLLESGRLHLTLSTVQATAWAGFQNPAIATNGGEVVLDPTTVLTPVGGAPPITGPATVTHRDLVSLSGSTDGSTLTTDLHGPAGADFVTLLSFPVPAMPTPFGSLWLDPSEHLVADFGTLDATRSHRWSLPHTPVPSGFTVTLQTVIFTGTFELSTPTVIAFP